MKSKITNLINELNTRLSQSQKDFDGVYLFESYALENANIDSDVDLICLFKKVTKKTQTFIFSALSDLMYKYDIFIDIKIMDEKKLKSNPFFYKEITTK